MINYEEFPIQQVILRLGLLGTASLLFQAATNTIHNGLAPIHPQTIVWSMVIFFAAVSPLIVSLLRPVPAASVWSILPACLIYTLGSVYLQQVNDTPLTQYSTDNARIGQYALTVLEAGGNPYEWDYTDVLRVYRDSLSFTPFSNGAPQHRVTYPALPTLLLALLNRFGIQGSTFNLFMHAVLLIALFVLCKPDLRPIILLPLFVLQAFLDSTLFGVGDIVWSAMLVLMLAAWRYRFLRALLFGLAISYRQQPWFIMPFLLIQIWHDAPGQDRRTRFREIVIFSSISLGFFALVNLPFLLAHPQQWITSVLEPVYATFNIDGVGFNALWRFGLLPLNRDFFTLLQFTAYAAALCLYWRHRKLVGASLWLIPALFFWLYYRSLSNYWYFWIPPLLFTLVSSNRSWIANGKLAARPVRPLVRDLAIALAALLLVNGLHAASIISGAPTIQINLQYPLETFPWGEALINRIRLQITNDSDLTITPRFFGQRATASAAYPWIIESGPLQLKSHEFGEYVITADRLPRRMLIASQDSQIILEDANGNYAARQVLTIPASLALNDTDLIANPYFDYWPVEGNAPERWSLENDEDMPASISRGKLEDRPGLALVTTRAAPTGRLILTRVSQTIAFRNSFNWWIYPPENSQDMEQTIYGLEIDDGTRHLWLLFGDGEEADGAFTANHRYLYRHAPGGQWSRQHIDIESLYEQVGWSAPLPSKRQANELIFYTPQVKLSLIVGERGAEAGRLWFFGAFDQEYNALRSDELLHNLIEHPFEYYYSLGLEYMKQRNDERALQSLLQAVSYNTSKDPVLYFAVAERTTEIGQQSSAAQSGLDDALQLYQQAIDFGFDPSSLAYKGIAWIQLSLGDAASASENFERALSLGMPSFDEEANAYAGLSLSQFQMGNCEAAKSNREIALRLGLDSETLLSIDFSCE